MRYCAGMAHLEIFLEIHHRSTWKFLEMLKIWGGKEGGGRMGTLVSSTAFRFWFSLFLALLLFASV